MTRWLAVAPNGDVSVADSAAGETVVLHGVSGQGSACPAQSLPII